MSDPGARTGDQTVFATRSSPPPAPTSGPPPTPAPKRPPRGDKRRHARVVVRKVGPWSVLKISLLFYAALWSQGHHAMIMAGAATAVAALAVIAWLMLRYSRKLPFGTFFAASAVLVAVLAVVLAGKGVAALQEAGWLPVSLVAGPRIDLLGIHPTLQGVGTQLAVLAVLLLGFGWNARNARNARAAVAAR